MRQSLFLFLFVIFTASGFAQNIKADSIKKLLPKAKNDIQRVDLLNSISDAYKTSDPEQMKSFANQAFVLSKKIGYILAEATAHQNLGNYNIISGNYLGAADEFNLAKSIFSVQINGSDKLKAQSGMARALGSLGVVFSEQSNYARALFYDLEAVAIYEKLNDREKLAQLYNNTAVVYSSEKNSFKALEYLLKALPLLERSNNPAQAITLTNIGNNYLTQKDLDKACTFYGKAETAFERFPDSRAQGELYNNLGVYHFLKKQPVQAEDSWKKALEYFGKIGDEFGSGDTRAQLSDFYLSQNKLPEALLEAQKSLDLSQKLQIPEQIVIAEKLLSNIYKRQGNLDLAIMHLEKYNQSKDSLQSRENIRKSVQAEMNYEFEKQQTINRKEAEKKELVYAETSKRHHLQTFFVALLVLLIAGIAFLIYNRSQLKKNLTLQKELAEYEQKALHLQMNPHFVFNCLGSISSFIVQNGTDQAIKYLAKFSKLMRLTLEYSKESLIPIDREIEGLQNYLELEQLRFNTIFEFTINKSSDIEDDMALPPLLLQPFIENAIIHGLVPLKKDGKITVDFSVEGEFLICTVTDNGIGIHKANDLKKDAVPVHKSMALDITKKRLDMIQSITSKPADVEITETVDDNGNTTGTRIKVRLPVQFSGNQ